MKDNALKNKRLMLLFAAVAAMVIAMAGLAGCGGNSAPSSALPIPALQLQMPPAITRIWSP